MKRIILIIMVILSLIPPLVSAASPISLVFWGVQGELLKNIQERMAQLQANAQIDSAAQVKAFSEESLVDLKDALAAFGYFRPTVHSSLQHKPPGWEVVYTIHPGPELHITQMDMKLTGEGSCDPAFQTLLHNLPLHQGDVINSKCYQDTKSLLTDLAVQRGYFDAQLTQSNILVDLQRYQATVVLHFDTGHRYFFGHVNFLPSVYAPSFLQRFVQFKPGRPYQNPQVVELQENLAKSNFFQEATVTPRPEQAEDLNVPIDVMVTPRKRIQYNLGAGFGSDTGARGLADLQIRRLNPYGHSINILTQGSQRINHGEASYIIPGRNPVTDYYKLSVAGETQNLPTSGKSRNEKIEASYVSAWHHWQQTLSLSLRDERSDPTEDRPTINSTMLLPNINWLKIKSDDPLSPNCGYQININIRGASKATISNVNFLQALIQTKYLHTFHENTRIILKGQLGYTFINDVDFLPISLQFYTGGAQTVRGYRYQQIGPGRTLLLASIELQQRIKGNFYGAVFFDAGNVSNDLTNDLKKSVGLGIVWRSPIGAIEMTLAQALDQPGHPKLLQISMGPEL